MDLILEHFLGPYWAAHLLATAAIIFASVVSANTMLVISKYKKKPTAKGVPAHIVARQLLDSHGLEDVIVEKTSGFMTDHYNPRRRSIGLSNRTYHSASVGAVAIAAHECAHAVQHAKGYGLMRLRLILAPIVTIANYSWIILIILGSIIYIQGIFIAGVAAFAIAAVFQLVTLPVELDASKRAMKDLVREKELEVLEMKGAREVLSAAAKTYVASLIISLTQLYRILMIARGRGGRN